MPNVRSIERHDGTDVERQRDAAGDAEQRADDADQRALDDEDRRGCSRRRAQRAQDRDVGLLVGDHHHLRGDDVERRDGDDQRQDDEHDALLDRDRAEEIGVAQRPVAHLGVDRHAARSSSRATSRRGEHVVELEPHAARPRRPCDRASARPRGGSARAPLSNSNMPTSKMPTTRKLLTRGSVPAGVTVPCGVMTTTESPSAHARAHARARRRARCRIRPA